ncbi:polysaccharide pyruvyl transferase family protein [Arthrobacter sp. ZBG10]|uniref:polysaccharide pyruvyl transferase family protein n=1 Tax=Arthrobacter sp. ZBG10 TaxID=1676590 RepID=UPI000A812B53|nr:polysaccharide pyruvyl transferase family protein [Arthrobacter sp. ZBG10]
MKSNKPLMVVLTGAYGNIGDGVIRRRIFGWVRDLGPIHAYVGNATDDWIEQLGLSPEDKIYRSADKIAWMKLSVSSTAPAALILDPGEVPLDRKAFIPEGIFTALTWMTRLRGGVVVRPPRGVGKSDWATKAVHRMGVAASQIALWRNQRSMDLIRRGELSPDTAFQEDFTSTGNEERRDLIISLRAARPYPSPAWFETIRTIQESYGVKVAVASQVREDEPRSRELAAALGAEYVAWGTAKDLAHEGVLRARYHNAKIVVSDRLHVLILAALAGAVPLEIVDRPKDKVALHFAQIGAPKVSIDVSDSSVEEMTRFINDAVSGLPNLRMSMESARNSLNNFEQRVRNLVQSAG